MNLRWKIALALAAVSFVATTAVGIISYRSTSERLVDEVDRSIASAAAQLSGRPGGRDVPTRDILDVYAVRLLDVHGDTVASSFRDGGTKTDIKCSAGAGSSGGIT